MGRLVIEKLFETDYEKAVEGATAVDLINKIAPDPVTEEDVVIRRARLANTKIDRSFEQFSEAQLRRFAQTVVGKAMLPGHDKRQRPLGRVFDGSVQQAADGHHHLVIDFYMRKGSEIAEDVRLGIAKDLSIGFAADYLECSTCGEEYIRNHKHIAGMSYDGAMCVAKYAGDAMAYEAREASFVWLGCQHDTGTLAGKSLDDPFAGRVVWKSADLVPDPAKGDERMTEQEKAEFDARGDEVKALKAKVAELEPKAAAGDAYFGSLKDGIIDKARVLGDDVDIYTAALAGTNLASLQKWNEALQKRFDEKFPPNASARMLGAGAVIDPAHNPEGSADPGHRRKSFAPLAGLKGGA